MDKLERVRKKLDDMRVSMKKQFDELYAAVGGREEPVPEGNYNTEVIDVEERVSAMGTKYVRLKLKIKTGPYKGRILYTNIVYSYCPVRVSHVEHDGTIYEDVKIKF